MNEQNNPVEEVQVPLESVQDDAAQAQPGESLETLLNEDVADTLAAEGAPGSDTQPPAREPGWIKQRVNRAVERAVAEAEARVAARYEARFAPLMEAVLDRQAQDLVAAGEFKTLERAKEYVRLKGGVTDMPAPGQTTTTPPPAPAQPRDAQGRFQSSETRVRAELLARQATKIKSSRGLDVMQTFNADPEVKAKVISGEWDFHDVADHMASGTRRVPSPVRSPNGAGASAAATTIDNMTDAQFARMCQNIAMGHRYNAE